MPQAVHVGNARHALELSAAGSAFTAGHKQAMITSPMAATHLAWCTLNPEADGADSAATAADCGGSAGVGGCAGAVILAAVVTVNAQKAAVHVGASAAGTS